MNDYLPVNTEILIWARESSGLTVDELAFKLKKTKEEILNWERGISSPSYPVLEKMAYDIFKRPVAVFFFPDLPYEDTLRTTFRTLPGTEIDILPREILSLFRKASVLQINLYDLQEESIEENIFLSRYKIDLDSNIRDIAARVRIELGVSIDEQIGWKDAEKALKKWRSLLERKGITIFKDSFKNDSFSGFCLFDDKHPVIYLNNGMSFARQVFTIFHELAHLLFKTSGIDYSRNTVLNRLTGSNKQHEILCNHFAGEFLVPMSTFKRIPVEINDEFFEHMSILFSVSKEVILRKCYERHLCDEFTYAHYADKWNESRKAYYDRKEKIGGNYYNNITAYLGEKYIQDSFKAYYKNKINHDQLSDFLNLSVKSTIELEKRMFG